MLNDTRASIHPTILSLNSELKFDKKFQLGQLEGDSINIAGKIPVDFKLNYFLTIDGGIKWKGVIPYPAIKKFETGFDGNFGLPPQFTIGFSKEVSLPKDKEKVSWLNSKAIPSLSWLALSPLAAIPN